MAFARIIWVGGIHRVIGAPPQLDRVPMKPGQNLAEVVRCRWRISHGDKFLIDRRCRDLPNVLSAILDPEPLHDAPIGLLRGRLAFDPLGRPIETADQGIVSVGRESRELLRHCVLRAVVFLHELGRARCMAEVVRHSTISKKLLELV